MLIAEKLLLLSRTHDGDSRLEGLDAPLRARWVASAVLAELAVLGRLRFLAGKLVAPDDFPTSHSALTDLLSVLFRRRAMGVQAAIDLVRSSHRALEQELLESMVRRGLLLEVRQQRLLFLSRRGYAVQSTQALAGILGEMRQFIASQGRGELAGAALLALGDAVGLLHDHLPAEERHAGFEALQELERSVSGPAAATDQYSERARLLLTLTRPPAG